MILGKHIFLRLLLPLVAGIAAGQAGTLSAAWSSGLSVFLLAFIIIILILHLHYKRLGLYLKPWYPGFLFQLFIFMIAFFHAGTFLLDLQKFHFSRQHSRQLLVEICSEPQEKPDITRFEVLVCKALGDSGTSHSGGNLLISCRIDSLRPLNFSIGDRLLVPSQFSEIPGPANPGEFDYKKYMGSRGVWHQAFFEPSEISVVGRVNNNIFYEAVKLRKKVVMKLNRYISDTEAAAVISTLLLGYKADLSREIINTYSATGAMHVLSVSGMHVAIVAALAGYLLGFWKGRKMNLIQALLIVIFVWLYTLLSGLSAAACRAAIMISFVIAGRLINRQADMLNCVSAAAFFQLLVKPVWLSDIGFQLSYVAVFGLIVFYPLINKMLNFRSPYPALIWSYIAFSLAAQLATFPLCLYYFNQFPLYFLASNIFIMLPVTVVMYAGVGFLLLAMLPNYADMPLRILAWLMENGIGFLNCGLRVIGRLPSASLYGYHMHMAFYLLIYAFIAVFAVGLESKNKRLLWYSLFLLLVMTSFYSVSGLIIWNRKSVMFYAIKKHFAMAFIRTGVASLVTDMELGDRAVSYSVMPLIRNRNLKVDRVVHLDTLMLDRDLRITGSSICFENLQIEVIDGKTWSGNLDELAPVSPSKGRQHVGLRLRQLVIVLHDNPVIEVPDLLKIHNIRYLIIGTKNNKQNTDRWLLQANSLGIDCRSLKRQGALELDL